MTKLPLPKSNDHAIVAYLIKKYSDVAHRSLGRTILQKLCYLSRANGVPLSLYFDIHHYGPFSVDLFRITDDLLAYDIVKDESAQPAAASQYIPGSRCGELLRRHRVGLKKYETTLDTIVNVFSGLMPSQLELLTTIHYIYCSLDLAGTPKRGSVINTVYKIKGDRFTREDMRKTYNALENAGLLTWSPKQPA